MTKRAIVMGATSGIGREVALQLASKGYAVGIAGRREERLAELEATVPGIVAHRQIDVTCDNAPSQLLGLIAELGGMDVYFHSSGIGWENVELDADKEIKTTATNAMGFVRMVTAAFNWFAEHDGEARAKGEKARIACITSIARTRGLGAAPAYSATKRMQSHYLECLAQLARMRRLHIAVTDIRPGFVAKDLIAGSNFPLQLKAGRVAKDIVGAMERGREVVTVDWRYRLLTLVWRMVPRCVWIRLRGIE